MHSPEDVLNWNESASRCPALPNPENASALGRAAHIYPYICIYTYTYTATSVLAATSIPLHRPLHRIHHIYIGRALHAPDCIVPVCMAACTVVLCTLLVTVFVHITMCICESVCTFAYVCCCVCPCVCVAARGLAMYHLVCCWHVCVFLHSCSYGSRCNTAMHSCFAASASKEKSGCRSQCGLIQPILSA